MLAAKFNFLPPILLVEVVIFSVSVVVGDEEEVGDLSPELSPSWGLEQGSLVLLLMLLLLLLLLLTILLLLVGD